MPRFDDERVIFFNQISENDVRLAQRYGYKYIGAETNIGIAEGYKRLVEYATGELFLFLENDWELIEKPDPAITDARFLLSTNTADLVKLRHRKNPGNPLWSRQYQNKELTHPEYLLDSIHWSHEYRFEQIKPYDIYGRKWYTTTSQYANWSNNPHMAWTSWLKTNILPQIGSGDIEKHMQSWWQEQEFKVAQGEGLFTHNRLD